MANRLPLLLRTANFDYGNHIGIYTVRNFLSPDFTEFVEGTQSLKY